jgi:predicted outer membrane repeat protein
VSGGAASGASVFGDKGGGIFNYWSLTLTNSINPGNAASKGGGLYSTGRSVQDNNDVCLTNNTVSGNTAGTGGGAFVGNYSRVNLTNSTGSGNTAVRNGGGMFDFGYNGGSLSMNNCTVSANLAAESGGGLYTQYSSVSNLINTTFSGNSAREGGRRVEYWFYSPHAHPGLGQRRREGLGDRCRRRRRR